MNAGPALVLRCAACAQFRHADCAGRGQCACRDCLTSAIMADAAQRHGDRLVRELRALLLQRVQRQRQIDAAPPLVRPCSECSTLVRSKRHGRDRITCSERCRKRRRRRLAKEATGYAHGRSMARSLTGPAGTE